ncbi:hypothetical protein GGI21_001300, partial [Coemansia aciculifera]
MSNADRDPGKGGPPHGGGGPRTNSQVDSTPIGSGEGESPLSGKEKEQMSTLWRLVGEGALSMRAVHMVSAEMSEQHGDRGAAAYMRAPPEAIDPETIETMTALQAWAREQRTIQEEAEQRYTQYRLRKARDEELRKQEAAIKAAREQLAAELAEDLKAMKESTRARKELDEKRNAALHGKTWGSEAAEAARVQKDIEHVVREHEASARSHAAASQWGGPQGQSGAWAQVAARGSAGPRGGPYRDRAQGKAPQLTE